MTRLTVPFTASAAAAALAALFFGGCIVHTPIGGDHCVREDGRTFRPGETFPSADGCNTCSCGSDGAIACTARACVGDGGVPDGGGCVTPDGRRVASGTSFPSPDGCNTCSCGPDGSIACTARACADAGPPPADGGGCVTPDGRHIAPGTSFPSPDGCNTCTCGPDGLIACTERACADAGPPPPPDGGRTCSSSRECNSGEMCIGPAGCGVPWTCQPARPCTADFAPFCSCRGVTVYGSSSCPPEPYAHFGACTDAGTLPPTDGGPSGGCIRTGCSGQICADHDVITTCEWRAEYACYATARCERQPDGTCNWTDTPELRACLGSGGGGTDGGSGGGGSSDAGSGGLFCAVADCAPGFICCESLRTCLDARMPFVCP